MSAALAAGDVVRTRTGSLRVVTRVFVPVGADRPTYALRPLSQTGRARRSYAETVTLVRTAELARFYYLLDDAGRRERRDAGSGRFVLAHARRALEAARDRAMDGRGELAAAARSYRLAVDAWGEPS